MANNAQIPVARTEAPSNSRRCCRASTTFPSLSGPNGANKSGALSRLLSVSAENLRGNGSQINSTIKNVAALVGTLADNKTNLTGTINNLATFTNALQQSDGAVRTLTNDLSTFPVSWTVIGPAWPARCAIFRWPLETSPNWSTTTARYSRPTSPA